MMEVMVTTGVLRRAQLQSNRHHQETNTQLLQAGCPSCRPTDSVKARMEKSERNAHGRISGRNIAPMSACEVSRNRRVVLIELR